MEAHSSSPHTLCSRRIGTEGDSASMPSRVPSTMLFPATLQFQREILYLSLQRKQRRPRRRPWQHRTQKVLQQLNRQAPMEAHSSSPHTLCSRRIGTEGDSASMPDRVPSTMLFPATLQFQREILHLSLQKKQRQRRRPWQHRINEVRIVGGAYEMLYSRLRQHPAKFINFMRMTPETFDVLLEHVSPLIQQQNTQLRDCVPLAQRLMVTLRYLATGESFMSLHYLFRLGKSTISTVVIDTCMAIWEALRTEYMPVPTAEHWASIAKHFLETTQFPNCLGAVGGKHVLIQKPPRTGSEYFNYKKYFSIILMAIADSRYRFVAVDIGAYGCTNDSRAFHESDMGRRIYAGDNLPAPQPLPGTEGPQPFVLVGDEAFKMSSHLLKPYPSRGLNYRRRVFNYRLTRARRVVECAFGIMTAKWRIFHKPIQLKEKSIDHVVKACAMLHNFVLAKEPIPVDPLDYPTQEVSAAYPSRPTQAAAAQRDAFAEYFLSATGWVEWQDRQS